MRRAAYTVRVDWPTSSAFGMAIMVSATMAQCAARTEAEREAALADAIAQRHALMTDLAAIAAVGSDRTRCSCRERGGEVRLVPRLADPFDPAERARFAGELVGILAARERDIAAQTLVTWVEAPIVAELPRWWSGAHVIGTARDEPDPAAALAVIEARRNARAPLIDRLLHAPNRWHDPEQVRLVELEIGHTGWFLTMSLLERSSLLIVASSPLGRLVLDGLPDLAGHGLVRIEQQDAQGAVVGRGSLLRRVAERDDLVPAFGR